MNGKNILSILDDELVERNQSYAKFSRNIEGVDILKALEGLPGNATLTVFSSDGKNVTYYIMEDLR